MPRVLKSVLVPYSDAQMFGLVDAIADYPLFLPWCGGTQVLAAGPAGKTARIEIDYHGVRAHFTTDNRNQPPHAIDITLKDGPFKALSGQWRFRALAPAAAKVELELAYEFATPVLGMVVGPVFNHIANTFIDAFVRRAQVVYGPPA
jgi:ribosome-associated toxin RatA of RatAB toxin-antitoxin module